MAAGVPFERYTRAGIAPRDGLRKGTLPVADDDADRAFLTSDLAEIGDDGALTVLDPDRALGAANLVSAHRFSGAQVSMAADAAQAGDGALLVFR